MQLGVQGISLAVIVSHGVFGDSQQLAGTDRT